MLIRSDRGKSPQLKEPPRIRARRHKSRLIPLLAYYRGNNKRSSPKSSVTLLIVISLGALNEVVTFIIHLIFFIFFIVL